jgi:hypothetical protein
MTDGTFVAYLTEGASGAADRLGSSRGWIRVDGAPVADSAAELAAGPLAYPPRMDEFGNDVLSVGIYTGTTAGVPSADTCLDWTSNLDTVNGEMIFSHWSSTFAAWSSTETCDSNGRLFCVETGKNVAVTIKPETGRLAFISTQTWNPGAGIADADALCANEAGAAQIPGTFLAALATTTESIASRFPPGLPWRRADGVRITRDDGTMFSASFLDVAVERNLANHLVANDFWSGAQRFNVPADTDGNGNCMNWTIGNDTFDGDMHFTSDTWVGAPAKREPCDWDVPLLCLEQ